jgi:hypothetical protein
MWYRLLALASIILALLLLPLLPAAGLILLLFNLFASLNGLTRRQLPPDGAPASGLASIIVLNWNGKALLAEGLPSILNAVQADGRPHEVIVVDNGSTDGSLEYVAEGFPGVEK